MFKSYNPVGFFFSKLLKKSNMCIIVLGRKGLLYQLATGLDSENSFFQPYKYNGKEFIEMHGYNP